MHTLQMDLSTLITFLNDFGQAWQSAKRPSFRRESVAIYKIVICVSCKCGYLSQLWASTSNSRFGSRTLFINRQKLFIRRSLCLGEFKGQQRGWMICFFLRFMDSLCPWSCRALIVPQFFCFQLFCLEGIACIALAGAACPLIFNLLLLSIIQFSVSYQKKKMKKKKSGKVH